MTCVYFFQVNPRTKRSRCISPLRWKAQFALSRILRHADNAGGTEVHRRAAIRRYGNQVNSSKTHSPSYILDVLHPRPRRDMWRDIPRTLGSLGEGAADSGNTMLREPHGPRWVGHSC